MYTEKEVKQEILNIIKADFKEAYMNNVSKQEYIETTTNMELFDIMLNCFDLENTTCELDEELVLEVWEEFKQE